jgi:DegV family protein with EDD domain
VRFSDAVFDGDAGLFWQTVRDARGVSPTTSAPTVAHLADAYRSNGPVIAVHVSGELSSTLEHAQQAATETGGDVHVIDSRSVSVGVGLIAIAAAEAVRVGMAPGEVLELVRGLVLRVHVHGVIDDADYLRRSGRTGLIDRHTARRTPRHVVAVQGHAIPLRQFRERRQAINYLLEHLVEHARHGIDRWALAHADAADVDAVVGQVTDRFGSPPAFVALVGPTVGAHVGPDALIVGFVAGR